MGKHLKRHIEEDLEAFGLDANTKVYSYMGWMKVSILFATNEDRLLYKLLGGYAKEEFVILSVIGEIAA